MAITTVTFERTSQQAFFGTSALLFASSALSTAVVVVIAGAHIWEWRQWFEQAHICS